MAHLLCARVKQSLKKLPIGSRPIIANLMLALLVVNCIRTRMCQLLQTGVYTV